MTRSDQIRHFLGQSPFSGAEWTSLAGDASFRRYHRVTKDGKTAMLMDAPPDKENVKPYLAVARHLHAHGYSAPRILADNPEQGLVLIEDFGDESFTVLLNRGIAEAELYEAAIDLLTHWHQKKESLADPQALALPAYDQHLLLKEVSLFGDWYLPQVLGKEQAAALRPEFLTLWQSIIRLAPLSIDQWVHRDYHVDNLMWLPERQGIQRVGLLDFQDGVYGDAAYDLVSLLEDARRDVPPALAERLLARYAAANKIDHEAFMTAYAVLGAQRNCKIIGIFVRLAARDGKAGYLRHLPRVWRYLEQDLKHPALAPLKTWLDKHVPAAARGVIAVKYTSRELALPA